MPIDQKYGHIRTERGAFTDAEPVFVIRAKDALAPKAVEAYAALAEAAALGSKCDDEECCGGRLTSLALDARAVAEQMREWQIANTVKLPD